LLLANIFTNVGYKLRSTVFQGVMCVGQHRQNIDKV